LSSLEEFGLLLKGSGTQGPAVIITDPQRMTDMLQKFQGRIEDIYERQLVRLTRITGLQIEDERAKTNYLSALGYLARLHLEREKMSDLLKNGDYTTNSDLLIKISSRIRQYNILVEDIKENSIFGTVIKRYSTVNERNFVRGFFEYDLVEVNGKQYCWTKLFPDRTQLKAIAQDIVDNCEHIVLCLLGKALSGK
jgi:hypothetical protein